jgi:sugar lactone lactonase YvrE
MSAPIGGGAVAALTTTASWVGGVALDVNNVYFTNGTSGDNNDVSELPLGDGGAITVLAGRPGVANALALGGTSLYWTETGENIVGQPPPATDVMSAPIAGGAPVTIASGQIQPSGIATDATNVYWANQGGDGDPGDTPESIVKAPLAGGTPVTLASGVAVSLAIAVDDESVYFADHAAGVVGRVPKAGGAMTTLLSGLTYPNAIAVDATSVYVGTEGLGGALTGTLLKITPK